MTVRVWDVEKREQVALMTRRTGGPQTVAFSSDGKWLAAAHEDGTLLLWEVNLPAPGQPVEPAGKQMVTWGEVKKTELYQNFPNPFNPETWIPFRLAKASDVTIRIYQQSGELVRTLRLGRKEAGTYTEKSRAGYWDGRNNAGERVASGLYFYTLAAGDFSRTRKMTLLR
jgi:WD40 repeat protein